MYVIYYTPVKQDNYYTIEAVPYDHSIELEAQWAEPVSLWPFILLWGNLIQNLP